MRTMLNTYNNQKGGEYPKSLLPNYKWIKYWISSLDDIDFMQLSNEAVGFYLKLYLLAGSFDAAGLLCMKGRNLTKQEIAWYCRTNIDETEVFLDQLVDSGFLGYNDMGYTINSFLEQQGPGDEAQRDQWRESQAKHRKNKGKTPEMSKASSSTLKRVEDIELEEETVEEPYGELEEEIDEEPYDELDEEEETEEEEAEFADFMATIPLTPESDFLEFTEHRMVMMQSYCKKLKYKPSATKGFIKEHLPAKCFESRIISDALSEISPIRDVACKFIESLTREKEDIFDANYDTLCKIHRELSGNEPSITDMKYLESEAEKYFDFDTFRIPMQLSKNECITILQGRFLRDSV